MLCLVIISVITFISCRKTDIVAKQAAINTDPIVEKFFNTNRTGDPTEKAFVNFLASVNEKDNFVAKTVKQIGYPRWDKILTRPTNKKGGGK